MHRKKRDYDPYEDYVEDMDGPDFLHRFLLFTTDPIWYRMMLTGIIIEVLNTTHAIASTDMLSVTQLRNMEELGIIFNGLYMLDVSCAFVSIYVLKLQYVDPNPIKRPIFVMILELISTLPINVFVDFRNKHDLHYYLLRMLRILKLPRFLYHTYNNRRGLENRYTTRVIEFISFLLIAQFVLAAAYHFYLVRNNESLFVKLYDIISCKVNAKGSVPSLNFGLDFNELSYELPMSIASLLVLLIIIKPTVCYTILALICDYEHKFNYIYKVDFFRNVLRSRLRLKDQTYTYLMQYFELFWKRRGKFMYDMQSPTGHINPFTLRLEISMDFSWMMFQHSTLFRDMDLDFLRFLATLMKKSLKLPSEYMYKKGNVKSQMIYIINGIVEVLSGENGESGIIKLSSGTCVGAASLILPNRAICDFRCLTACEIITLERDDFLLVTRKHPTAYKQVLQNVWHRYENAHYYFDLKMQKPIVKRDLIWLKSALHKYMAFNKAYSDEHQEKNIYLSQVIAKDLDDDYGHTKMFLNNLAIYPRYSTEDDLVFIKSSCLWILRYNSPIHQLWNMFIIILSVCAAILIPYGCCVGFKGRMKTIETAIHSVWILDLLVQTITPISEDSKAQSHIDLFSERFRRPGFILDLLAAFELKILESIFFKELEGSGDWLELNKVIKIWRLFDYFNKVEKRFHFNTLLYLIIKLLTIFFFLVYYIHILFTADGVVEFLSPLSIQLALGVAFMFQEQPLKESIIYIIANNCILLYELLTLISIATAYYLHIITKRRINNFIDQLFECAEKHSNLYLLKRLRSYLNMQMNENQGLDILTNTKNYYNLPLSYEILMRSDYLLLQLEKLQFFQGLPRKILVKLIATSERFTYHVNAQILSRGVIYNNVYMLLRGVTKTIIGKKIYTTKPGSLLNILENCFGTPSVCAVVAFSETTVISFNYFNFIETLKENRLLYDKYLKVIADNQKIKMILLRLLNENRIHIISKTPTVPSVMRFKKPFKHNSFEAYDYYTPFDRLYSFAFIEKLLMNFTIHPKGRLLYRWEFSRCVFAYASAIIFTTPWCSGANIYAFGFWCMIVLDVAALVDIYFRLHVCYYDSNGILIKHPLSTAKHYLKNGFIIDLLGMFPFYLILYNKLLLTKLLFNLLHCLQLHRMIQYRAVTLGYNWVVNVLYGFAFYMLILNILATLVAFHDCYDHVMTFIDEQNCRLLRFDKYFSHVYACFILSSAFVNAGTEGLFKSHKFDNFIAWVICVTCLIGLFVKIFMVAVIFGSYVLTDYQLYHYRVGFKHLIRLLKSENCTSVLLEQELRRYYSCYYDWLGTYNPKVLFKNLTLSLKRDLLYDTYGANMCKNMIFNSTNLRHFVKNLLLDAEPFVVPKDGYVLTINDIHGKLFMVCEGSVDVVTADGTCLKSLNVGSIFGNLENIELHRQRVSIIANTTVRCLHLPTTTFFKFLGYFPQIYEQFHLEKLKNVYYINGLKPGDKYKPCMKPSVKTSQLYKLFIGFKNLNLSIGCYIGLLFELYQIAVGEVHVLFLLVLLFFDVLNIIDFILHIKIQSKFNEDDYNDMGIIHSRQRTLDCIFSCLPIDYIVIMFKYTALNKSFITYRILRTNRLFKVYFIIEDYRKQTKCIVSNRGNTVRAMIVCYQMILSCTVLAAFLAVFDSIFANETSYIFKCTYTDKVKSLHYREDSSLKMILFIKYFYYSVTVHRFTADHCYYVTHEFLIRIFVFINFYFIILGTLILCQFYEIVQEIAYLRLYLLKATYCMECYTKSSANFEMLKQKISQNFKHYWDRIYDKNDILLIDRSPPYLQEAVYNKMYGVHFEHHPVFSKTHIDFLRQLGRCIRVVLYTRNDTIIYKNDDRECMFFIHQGEVAVLEDECDYLDKAVYVLKAYDSFGILQGLYANKASDFTYRTTASCVIVELELSRWKYLMDFFPASSEFIYSTANQFNGHAYIPSTIKQANSTTSHFSSSDSKNRFV